MSPGDGIPPQGSAEKSIGEIVGEVSEKASLLVREEIELAKAEVTDKFSKLGKGAGIAAAATAAPLLISLTLLVTSALASSISSRTRSEAFSEISATVWPSCCGVLWSSSVGGAW